MSDGQSTQLRNFLNLPVGEWDKNARQQLVWHAHERIRRLARKIFHADFPRLMRRHDTTSVVNQTLLRLLRSLEEIKPGGVREFFNLATVEIRRVLIDLVRQAGRWPRGLDADTADPSSAFDPVRVAMWRELLERIAKLPAEERDVAHHVVFLDMTQADVAKVLGVHPKRVSRLWLSAKLKLAECLPEPA